MILATYQPIKPNPNYKSKMDDLQEVFGYKPIWCVSAETLEEFLWQSYFCAPNYGEELIIFETDQYDTIDKCKWYDAIRLKTNTLDKNWINSDCKFKEYIVKDIKNVIFRMPMDLRDYSVRCDDLEEINPTLKVIFDKARAEQSQMMEVDILGNEVPFNPYREPVLFQNYICFNIEKRVLPIMYSLVVQHDPFDWLRFKGTANMRSWAHSTYINWCRNDCTEEALSKIVDEFYSFFDKSLEVAHRRIQHQKIGRNEPCPCGSGKKFKKCCGKNSAL